MKKKIYLTIDDAPSSHLPDKIDFLVEKGISAIIYCRGEFMEKWLDHVVYAIKKGYIIGNHSYTHPYFSEITIEDAKREIGATEALIEKAYTCAHITRPYKLFRFPYLDKGEKRSKRHAEELQELLRLFGFQKAIFSEVSYEYYKKNGWAHDLDAPWTFDAREYALFSEEGKKKHGLTTVNSFLQLMDKDQPENGFGLNKKDSSDIVLLHDFETTHHLFQPMVEHLIAKKTEFHLPVIS